MNNSAEDYVYIVEDAQGNRAFHASKENAMQRILEGTGFVLKIYRLWRTYEEKKP